LHAGDEQGLHEVVESHTPVFDSNYYSRQANCPRTRVGMMQLMKALRDTAEDQETTVSGTVPDGFSKH